MDNGKRIQNGDDWSLDALEQALQKIVRKLIKPYEGNEKVLSSLKEMIDAFPEHGLKRLMVAHKPFGTKGSKTKGGKPVGVLAIENAWPDEIVFALLSKGSPVVSGVGVYDYANLLHCALSHGKIDLACELKKVYDERAAAVLAVAESKNDVEFDHSWNWFSREVIPWKGIVGNMSTPVELKSSSLLGAYINSFNCTEEGLRILLDEWGCSLFDRCGVLSKTKAHNELPNSGIKKLLLNANKKEVQSFLNQWLEKPENKREIIEQVLINRKVNISVVAFMQSRIWRAGLFDFGCELFEKLEERMKTDNAPESWKDDYLMKLADVHLMPNIPEEKEILWLLKKTNKKEELLQKTNLITRGSYKTFENKKTGIEILQEICEQDYRTLGLLAYDFQVSASIWGSAIAQLFKQHYGDSIQVKTKGSSTSKPAPLWVFKMLRTNQAKWDSSSDLYAALSLVSINAMGLKQMGKYPERVNQSIEDERKSLSALRESASVLDTKLLNVLQIIGKLSYWMEEMRPSNSILKSETILSSYKKLLREKSDVLWDERPLDNAAIQLLQNLRTLSALPVDQNLFARFISVEDKKNVILKSQSHNGEDIASVWSETEQLMKEVLLEPLQELFQSKDVEDMAVQIVGETLPLVPKALSKPDLWLVQWIGLVVRSSQHLGMSEDFENLDLLILKNQGVENRDHSTRTRKKL